MSDFRSFYSPCGLHTALAVSIAHVNHFILSPILCLSYREHNRIAMAPLTRRNSSLIKKISTLQLRLAPLVPLPTGPPHPAFPKTLLAYHLLTEEELDSIAHYYHQSTPGPWSNHYPANMNWDKDFLARISPSASGKARRHSRRLSQDEKDWVDELIKSVQEMSAPLLRSKSTPALEAEGARASGSAGDPDFRAGLSAKDRIRIKRRKIGKFIGLVGMDTPAEEIAGRIQASMDRAIERSREELRRNEEIMMRRRKVG